MNLTELERIAADAEDVQRRAWVERPEASIEKTLGLIVRLARALAEGSAE